MAFHDLQLRVMPFPYESAPPLIKDRDKNTRNVASLYFDMNRQQAVEVLVDRMQ